MGLGVTRSAKTRAQDVVNAILADAEIWTWPDKNGGFGNV